MSQQGPLPFLEVCSVEVANAARTVEYLRRGLAGGAQGKFELGGGDLCSVLYRENGGTCAAPDAYVSPAVDPAPWYNPFEPGSASYLGLLLLDLTGYDSTVTRAATRRTWGLEGGLLGRQQRDARAWGFRGAMISADDLGAEYGLRWLTSVLKTTNCDECSTCDIRVRLACPHADCTDDTVGEWLSYQAALTAGPREVEKYAPRSQSATTDVLAGCREVVTVEFTITAADPWLYKRPEACLAPAVVGTHNACDDICWFLFGPAGDPVCCDVAPPETGGVLGAIFTLTSRSGMGPVLLEAYEECPGSAGSAAAPVLQLEISGVPAGGTVVVDCSREEITVTQPDGLGGEVTSNGDSLVMLPTGRRFDWIQVRDCDRISCLCARTSHPCSQGWDTTVAIQTQVREG